MLFTTGGGNLLGDVVDDGMHGRLLGRHELCRVTNCYSVLLDLRSVELHGSGKFRWGAEEVGVRLMLRRFG